MNVKKIEAGGVKVGMLIAEVDEDVTLEEMDLDAMDWQRVVGVKHLYGYRIEMTLFYSGSPKSGSHKESGTYDQLVYVETGEDGYPTIALDDAWACDYTEGC